MRQNFVLQVIYKTLVRQNSDALLFIYNYRMFVGVLPIIVLNVIARRACKPGQDAIRSADSAKHCRRRRANCQTGPWQRIQQRCRFVYCMRAGSVEHAH